MNASAASPGSSTSIAAAPAVVEGHQSSQDSGVSYTTTAANRVGPASRETQCDVAAEAVSEHDRFTRRCVGQHPVEVVDVRLDRPGRADV